MKTLQRLLFVAGIGAVILLAFYAGKVQGTVSTAYDHNAMNIVWFIGIHEALENGDTDAAKKLCGTATAGHIDVVGKAQYRRGTSPQLLAYALPFTKNRIRSHANAMLQATLQYSKSHPSFLDEGQISTLDEIVPD